MQIVRYRYMPTPIAMPSNSNVIGVGMENNEITLFVEQQQSDSLINRKFIVAEIGSEITPNSNLIGILQNASTFLFVFEVTQYD